MTQEQQETLNEIFLGKEDPDMAFKKPMTNKLKEEIDDIVFRCFEQGRYWGTGIGERIADQDYKPKEPIDRTEAVKAILTLINQKERELLERVEEAIGEDEAKNTNNMSVEERHKYFQWQVDHDGARDDLRSELRDRIKQLKEELNKEVK
jgi:hypothetical protein